MASTTLPARAAPRTFGSPLELASDVLALCRQAPPLAAAYLGGDLDASLRERVMVAVSRVNACAGCTAVHERWALHAGVSTHELDAIGLGDLAELDERNRAAIVYATTRAEARFRGAPDPELVALVRRHLTTGELRATEAVARMIAIANLSANTLSRAARVTEADPR